jgi:Spy/CpxP family protein refolding chaperone
MMGMTAIAAAALLGSSLMASAQTTSQSGSTAAPMAKSMNRDGARTTGSSMAPGTMDKNSPASPNTGPSSQGNVGPGTNNNNNGPAPTR